MGGPCAEVMEPACAGMSRHLCDVGMCRVSRIVRNRTPLDVWSSSSRTMVDTSRCMAFAADQGGALASSSALRPRYHRGPIPTAVYVNSVLPCQTTAPNEARNGVDVNLVAPASLRTLDPMIPTQYCCLTCMNPAPVDTRSSVRGRHNRSQVRKMPLSCPPFHIVSAVSNIPPTVGTRLGVPWSAYLFVR
ncbi:hypothetical protein BV22DRAFT_909093 [Leucogyrophana mollusca]|uniref:Uncharacterized protein n=1 Tax=Leucogyrophana mollusca TaxID=85980 RepID=A0ACB8AZL5_9AGAM|nr:hypothetical protein BV22DRAFT_909093 [Leucogyrophana mollusca]